MPGEPVRPFRVGGENSALIFVPDIRGFTEFVQRTDLQHGQYIIAGLMQTVIDANRLDLRLSEVEGDAILFYRPGPPPTVAEILKQAKRMFFWFHALLRALGATTTCVCPPCAGMSELTLKFVVHYGELREVEIDRFRKIVGRDVILAHRLLKNEVPAHEYVLMTGPYLAAQAEQPPRDPDWAALQEHVECVEDFGPLDTRYVSLTALRGRVVVPEEIVATVRAAVAELLVRDPTLAG